MISTSRPQYRTITASGWSGRVMEAGDGPPLVLLASPLVLARSYRQTFRRLARHFRTFVVELPGCGGASHLDEPWSMQEYADWMRALLDALGLECPIVIGHSNSGPIALLLAVRYPHRVQRMILADTTGFEPSGSLPRTLLGRALDCLLEPWLTLAAWHHVAYNAVVHWRNFWHQVRLSSTTDLAEQARHVTVPTLLAWGAHDHTVPLRFGRRAKELISHATLHICPTGSHDWLITRAEEFEAVITQACAAVERPS